MKLRSPLAVYVIWHPDFSEGQEIANFLYSILNRNVSKPLVRSIGIPVYFRNENESGERQPIKIDFDESEFTAIVTLVSTELMNDSHYRKYIDSILSLCRADNGKRRVYPVALNNNACNVSPNFSAINFIKFDEVELARSGEKSTYIKSHIKSSILHELCRFLMHRKRATEERESLDISPPIKLFISHSKHDPSKLDALEFRDHINSRTQLKTFFDVNDIAYGSDFGEQIKDAAIAKESALVVFQSDSYSDREWCRIEAITAKSAGCPIVIVNAIKYGEKRTFPYLGNCPSIRFNENFDEIIDLTLEQVLSNVFKRKFLDVLTDLYNIKGDLILSTPPELFNFIQLRKRGLAADEKYALVVYPDPPLGSEEISILSQLDSDYFFVTPIMLPSIIM